MSWVFPEPIDPDLLYRRMTACYVAQDYERANQAALELQTWIFLGKPLPVPWTDREAAMQTCREVIAACKLYIHPHLN